MTGFDVECDINLAIIYMMIIVAMCKFVRYHDIFGF